MGWNAGGFGQMTFANTAGLAAWRASTISHGTWDDWESWFVSGTKEPVSVEQQLAAFRKFHTPKEYGYLALDEHGTAVDFVLETGEDDFRAWVADLAALIRSAAPHGATGTFWFLGTAGAEFDFVYELKLADGGSTLESLGKAKIADVYEGDGYQQFMERVMLGFGMIEEGEAAVHAGSLAREEKTAAKKAAKPAKKSAKKPAKAAKKAAKPAKKQTKKPAKKQTKKSAKKQTKKSAKKPAKKPAKKKR